MHWLLHTGFQLQRVCHLLQLPRIARLAFSHRHCRGDKRCKASHNSTQLLYAVDNTPKLPSSNFSKTSRIMGLQTHSRLQASRLRSRSFIASASQTSDPKDCAGSVRFICTECFLLAMGSSDRIKRTAADLEFVDLEIVFEDCFLSWPILKGSGIGASSVQFQP